MYHVASLAVLFDKYFKLPLDQLPYDILAQVWLSERFRDERVLSWYEVYNLVVFMGKHCTEMNGSVSNDVFCAKVNEILTEEVAGYRFVGGSLMPLTNPGGNRRYRKRNNGIAQISITGRIPASRNGDCFSVEEAGPRLPEFDQGVD
jgi:hypothetical protein